MITQTERKRVNFGKITNLDFLPNLIQIQKKSFDWFLQADVKDPTKRKNQGLEAVFQETFPIESPNGDVIMEYSHYILGEKRRDQQECKDTDSSYAIPLKAVIRLIIKETGEIREQVVYMGDLPIMTDQGTFIINGAERVVVSQLHRSPGIFFAYDQIKSAYSARVIPYRGSWLEFEIDNKGILVAKIDRKKKFPATLLLKALKVGLNEDVLKLFYTSSKVKIYGASPKELKKVIGRRTISDIINFETGEVMLEAGA
ncbi:MAG TPA: DNA-directed RNA polymerase subunit beta, partial [Leptospiraceae bacterium]|nr:DNA-directed RNA polymerase subunit beta [Leptospiraceae bacterium]